MNFARVDLCQQLVSLTDWQGTDYLVKVATGFRLYTGGTMMGRTAWVPAYDTGYLLAKLPEPIMLLFRGGYWECGRADPSRSYAPPYYWQIEPTPADTLCCLCIELVRHNVILP